MNTLRLVLAAAVLFAGSSPAHAAGPYQVDVVSNYFSPARLTISSGETVQWTARNAGHAVEADDGRFRFPATGTFETGDTATFTFTTDDEWVRYHCAVHPEMRGTIKVGNPPVIGDGEPSEIRTVPGGYPTIAAALNGIPPGAAVDVAPGVYDVAVTLQTEGVRLRGTGAAPSDVVLRGDGVRAVGVTGRAAGVRVENLTLSGYTVAGVDMVDADHFVVERVGTDMTFGAGRGSYGILIRRSRYGRISDVEAMRAVRASVRVDECSPCDLIVERGIMRESTLGFEAVGSSSIIVRSSLVEDNVTGIALTNQGTTRQVGAHIFDNTLRGNTAAFSRRPTALLDFAPGIGIWVDGVGGVRVERNDIEDQRYGIAVTGTGGPTIANSISANRIAGSIAADLAWDGIGASTCFASNAGAEGAPTSEPPEIELLYPCPAEARPGVPDPYVTAKVVLAQP